AERLRGALAGYLVTVAQALEHRAETVERGLLEHRLGAACAQRPDAQLEAAWLELDIDAEAARVQRALGVGEERIGEQLCVGDAIRREVGTGGERAQHARQDGSRQRRRSDREGERAVSRGGVASRGGAGRELLPSALEGAGVGGREAHPHLRAGPAEVVE